VVLFLYMWKLFSFLFLAMINQAVAKRVIDQLYPGTAVARMNAARTRARSLLPKNLTDDWEDVRRRILWAAGLKDLPHARPGKGYTGHSFNDWNHVDACTMLGDVQFEENEGRVEGMHYNNRLGEGIVIASDPTLGEGGTWSTCMVRNLFLLLSLDMAIETNFFLLNHSL
jgi:hypothetical protein